MKSANLRNLLLSGTVLNYTQAGLLNRMNIPDRYRNVRQLIPDEVNFGSGGIRLFALADIEEGQVGYSIAADGTSLCSKEDGAWRSCWVVIGCETACGDPIFIETDTAAVPVFTAMHGQGSWHPNPVATSPEIFAKCVDAFSKIAAGRGNPMELQDHPLTDEERKDYLGRIAELNQTSTVPEFWHVLSQG